MKYLLGLPRTKKGLEFLAWRPRTDGKTSHFLLSLLSLFSNLWIIVIRSYNWSTDCLVFSHCCSNIHIVQLLHGRSCSNELLPIIAALKFRYNTAILWYRKRWIRPPAWKLVVPHGATGKSRVRRVSKIVVLLLWVSNHSGICIAYRFSRLVRSHDRTPIFMSKFV